METVATPAAIFLYRLDLSDPSATSADPNLHVKPVTASLSKSDRAAPIAHLFEAGKVRLHGRFPELEAELCGLIAGGGYEGPGGSPDRADAMVWALAELMLARKGAPQVRSV